jgi:hypothetical protein
MDSRGHLASAEERRDGDIECIREEGGRIGVELGEPGLDPIDLQVLHPNAVGELLPTQLLSDANLLNSACSETRFSGHDSHLSEADRRSNAISVHGVQVRVSVGRMPSGLRDLSYEDCEEWMRDLGYVTNQKADWERLLKDADVETDKYNLKKRWREGAAPEARSKIRATLERMELKHKERTPTGARILGLDEWLEAGRLIALDATLFASELKRAKQLAAAIQRAGEAARLKAEADAAVEAVLHEITPKPNKQRK